MNEPIDVYSDQFQFNLNPVGCVLNFMISDPVPPAPGSPPKAQRVASIRMSVENLKVLVFLLQRQIRLVENQTGVKAELPIQVLNSMQISPEDWNGFWKSPL